MASPATPSTIPLTPQYQHDHKDTSKSLHWASWQAALFVVKCAPRAASTQRWNPMSKIKINPNPFTTRPEIEGTFGVVTSTHWIATAVGMSLLEKGSNGFGARVATGFSLQVVEPHLNGPGGDVPIIVHDTKRGRTEVICGQGPAPAGANLAHYKREGLEKGRGTIGSLRSRHVRSLDAATARLRYDAAPRRAGTGHCLCPRRLSVGGAGF